MNGSNSNTSGNDVPTLNHLPASVYAQLAAALRNILLQYAAVQAGTTSPISMDFAEQGVSDQVPDAIMAEVARRLVATVDKNDPTANIVFGVTPPDDHSKAWQQVDPVTNLPVGQYQIWNNSDQKWESPTVVAATYAPPLERFTHVQPPVGGSVQTVNFADIKTTDYAVTITPTTRNGGSWNSGPSSFANGRGWTITSKSGTFVTIQFYAVANIGTTDAPVGESFDVWIRATPAP